MIHRLPLVEMASLARSGALSSLELVDAHLDRMEAVNPHFNAFTMVLADQARASARRADQGLKAGPLHGVPVTVKDSFDVAGLPTRLGSYFAPEVPAGEDSAVVQRLRRAGAIIIGKTNTPEFLASYETDNYITGREGWGATAGARFACRRTSVGSRG
jgi:Asp-tRNA(Asn)/Glu-tRNA(Gln) amidotransferase A subunit family amidase